MTAGIETIEPVMKTPADRLREQQRRQHELEEKRTSVNARLAERRASLSGIEAERETRSSSLDENERKPLPDLRRQAWDLQQEIAEDETLLRRLEDELSSVRERMAGVQRQLTLEAQRGVVDETRDSSRLLVANFSDLVNCVKTGLAAHDRLIGDQNALLSQLAMPRLRTLAERFPFEISELGRLLSVLADGVVADPANQAIDHGGRRIPLTQEEKLVIDSAGR